MKRGLCFAALVCLLMLLAGTACAAGLQENGFDYYVENGYAVVTGYQGNQTAITVPKTLGGYEVVKLDYDCFSGYDHLTSIKLPNTLQTIGWSAFAACRGLTSIEIPTGVTDIGRYAFSGCTNLRSVSLPDSLRELRRYAFDGCYNLRELVIPANVREISGNTLDGCSSLTKLTILGHETTFTDVTRFVMLERYGMCDVYCWKGSWAHNRLSGYSDFPLHVLEIKETAADNTAKTTPIKLVDNDAKVNPDEVTEESIPEYVPKKPVTKPTLLLTDESVVQAVTHSGEPVKLNQCFVTTEVLVDQDDTVIYDLEVTTSHGEAVSVSFDSPQPLLLPYPKGMTYEKALLMEFTVNHRTNGHIDRYSRMERNLFCTKGGMLLYTYNFSPYEMSWTDEVADPSTLPQTGDEAPSVALLLSVMAMCAAACFVLRRRTAVK